MFRRPRGFAFNDRDPARGAAVKARRIVAYTMVGLEHAELRIDASFNLLTLARFCTTLSCVAHRSVQPSARFPASGDIRHDR